MGPSSTLRKGDWKLIYYYSDKRFELFNLAQDLGEHSNLAGEEVNILRSLSLELSEYLRDARAPMPVVTSTGQLADYPDKAFDAQFSHLK
jgi:hypothetical protein